MRRFLVALFLMMVTSASARAEGEMTWADSLLEASKNHPDLIAAQEGIVQGQASKQITLSNALPQVTASLDASVSHSNNSGSSKSFSYGASGSQLLFDGFKTINNVHAASEDVKAARENFKFTSSTVRFRLRSAFIDLMKAQEMVGLAQDIYKIRKNNLDLINLRYQSGMEHKGALLTAQANLSQADADIHQAQRQLEVAQRELTKELGRKEFVPIVVKDNFQVSDAVLQKPDFEAIAANHPALLRAAAQENAAAFDVKASMGDWWPEISLTGDASKSDIHWPPEQSSSSGGLRVSLPLFEGGARVARVTQSKSIYRQLDQEKRSTKDALVLALEQNWSDLQNAVENVQVENNFLIADQERAKISEQQYSVALITYDNWTIIEDNLVNTKKQFLNVQVNALLAEANWIQAKGETLENENQ